ncbi:MAG: glycosyltransferase family 2 protein [Ruminococcaceae bacterium]|nr:glycosyltransferase family 2 protein [Oscillospiraceae bacterium]
MSENNVKVSVIMPVYKVEDYVGKAIESIQAQTLTEWELFAVDDGSPDNSGKICDEYAAKDSRIKVIHQANAGAPAARNAAMDKAVGEYMYFMDSDDWTEPTMLEDMYNIARENDRQLVIAGYYIDTYYNDEEKFTQEQVVDSVIYKTQKEFRENAHKLFDKNLLYTPWNKLFSAQYLRENNIYFPNTFWDDFPFNLSVVRDVERVAVTDKKYYHFIRKRAESETARYRSDMYDKREEENGWMNELYGHWNIMNGEVEEFLSRRYIERIIGCIENVTNKNCTLSTAEKKEQIKSMICSETSQKAVKLAHPSSLYMKVLLLPIKWKSVCLMYMMSCVISKVKSTNTKLFAKLKAGR